MKMTKFSLVLFIPVLFLFQPLQAQKKANIHYFTFTIDQQMITEMEVNRKGGGFLSGTSVGLAIPEYLTDSIKQTTEKAFSKKFKTEVTCMHLTTKKGIPFETGSMQGGFDKETIEGLPFVRFKKAAEAFKLDLYLQIMVSIEDGTSINMDLPGGKSKLKPMIAMNVKAFDKNKKVVWKNDVKIKDFGKLKQKTSESSNHEIRKGETLTPEMILEMYQLALKEVVKG